jgi:molybdopterin converting factor small subunit
MLVVVQVFSFLRDCLPPGAERGRVSVKLLESATLRDLLTHLDLNRCLSNGRRLEDELDSWQVSVNGEFIFDLNRELQSGDQVLIFPHLAGG